MAEEALGERPQTFTELDRLLEALPGLAALDVTTDTRPHHTIAVAALQAGKHVQVEKPMALTVTACNRMIEAAERAGRVLAVAENYRRDPLIRLVRALIEGGAIGDPWMVVDASVGGAGRMVITPWRHKKAYGNTLLDVGVHNVDLMLYEVGPVQEVYARVALFERLRRRSSRASQHHRLLRRQLGRDAGRGGGGRGGHRLRHPRLRRRHPGPVDDDLLRARAGIREEGHLRQPGVARAGVAPQRAGPKVYLDGSREPLPESELLPLVPDFAVDDGTARLFGGERLTSYSFDYPVIDRKITATVLLDFARAIVSGRPPEIGGVEGRHTVAVCNGLFESARLQRAVPVEALERGRRGGLRLAAGDRRGAGTRLMSPPAPPAGLSFGLCVPLFANPGRAFFRTPAWPALDPPAAIDAAVTAESLGYDSVWVADHLMHGHDGGILEGWTTLSRHRRAHPPGAAGDDPPGAALPRPGHAGQDGLHPGRPLRGAPDPLLRLWLERDRSARLRPPLAGRGGAHRPHGGGPAT